MINIYVGNLPYKTGEADLVAAFSQFGEVRRASIVIDRETGRSRGFGFVEMMDRESGLKAIEDLAGNDFNGRPLTINEARPRGSGTTGGPAGFASTTGIGTAELRADPEAGSRPTAVEEPAGPASNGYSNRGVATPAKAAPAPATDAESQSDASPPRDDPARSRQASETPAAPASEADAGEQPPSSGYSNQFVRDASNN